MDNADGVCRLNGIRYLRNDGRNLIGGQRTLPLGVILKEHAVGPFDGEKMNSG